MKNKIHSIDLIVPIYNEQENIMPLFKCVNSALTDTFSKIKVIIVDDGSTDNTEEEINKLRSTDTSKIKYVKLSRNFGKEIAVKSGIDNSDSDLCAVIDGDLQHPPEKIIEAYEKIKEGFNIVHISRSTTAGSIYREIGSIFFNKIINFFSPTKIHFTDFKLLDRKAVAVVKNYSEADYYNRGIIDLIGLKHSEIFYSPQKRKQGTSKFSLKKLINLAVDGLISVSIRPLRISIYFGLIISTFSFIWGLYILSEKIFSNQPIPGFTTLAVAMFFLGGIQLLFLGIIGEYVGKTFIESKKRPQYIIDHIKEL